MSKDEFTSVLTKSAEGSKRSKVDQTLFNIDKVSNFGKMKSRDHKWLYPAEKFDAESKFDLYGSFPKVNSKYARHKVHVNMNKNLGRSASESQDISKLLNLNDQDYNPKTEIIKPRPVKDVVNYSTQSGRDLNPYFQT
jgi:hypothetical protein